MKLVYCVPLHKVMFDNFLIKHLLLTLRSVICEVYPVVKSPVLAMKHEVEGEVIRCK